MCKEHLDSYCGIYCGACDVHRAGKTGHKSIFAHFFTKKNILLFQKALGITDLVENDFRVVCKGCKSNDVFVNCRSCKIRACARKNGIEHCIDCGDFPCKRYEVFKKGKAIFSHLETAPRNLETIKRAGRDAWLDEQDREWRCINCGDHFSWYSSVCPNCGQDLTERTYTFGWVRATIFKLFMMLNVERLLGDPRKSK